MKLFELSDANILSPADQTAEQIGDMAVFGVRRAEAIYGSSDPSIDAMPVVKQSKDLDLSLPQEPYSPAIVPGLKPTYKQIP